ncbi:MAG TPA: GspH/FimT family pseudopilin [Methylomirabilota bacterium]
MAPPRRQRTLDGERGFTVVELLVIVAIAGIIMAVSVPTLWTYFRTAALRAGAEELVSALNSARQLAIRSNAIVCVTNDGTRMQYRMGTCGGTIWAGPSTDGAGNVTLVNGMQVAGTNNLCYSYLGAGTATPAPCVNSGNFTVTNPAGGATMTVTVATTGRARIQ